MKKLFFIAALFMVSCSSSNDFEKGKQQLEAQGYTEIKNTGHRFFCCGNEDSYSTGFTAVDSKGEKVSGCMCSTILKGVTIRYK